MTTFVAIDFETANHYRDSACAVGLVKVENHQIVDKKHLLIRPPSSYFRFTDIHGITWHDVVHEPDFYGHWPQIHDFIHGADFLAAHNASFDRSVLYACCDARQIQRPTHGFECTVKLARKSWVLPNAKLPTVCKYLNIPLNHHEALSDAEACARIVIAAMQPQNRH
ncbi:MAG: 3'-5' exonuclease [Leptolyngbyaceae bacterium]|nr:3'-5' exonuclease [Leptolyngbyaceae bacterium]